MRTIATLIIAITLVAVTITSSTAAPNSRYAPTYYIVTVLDPVDVVGSPNPGDWAASNPQYGPYEIINVGGNYTYSVLAPECPEGSDTVAYRGVFGGFGSGGFSSSGNKADGSYGNMGGYQQSVFILGIGDGGSCASGGWPLDGGGNFCDPLSLGGYANHGGVLPVTVNNDKWGAYPNWDNGHGPIEALCYGIPPRDNRCNYAGEYQRFDLMTGSVTGDTVAQGIIEDQAYWVFDVTAELTLPLPIISGFNAASITYDIADYDNLLAVPGQDDAGALTIAVNGGSVTVPRDTEGTLGINGDTDTITAHIYGKLPGRVAGPLDRPPELTSLFIRVPVAATENLICDGGMELFPGIDPTQWWQQITPEPDAKFGRLNTNYNNPRASAYSMVNGLPACASGHQAVGDWFPSNLSIPIPRGSPIIQEFEWTGGDLAFKLRARGNSGHVYIMDSAGSIVVNLFGDGTYGGGALNGNWALITGSVNVDAGIYWLVLGSGPRQWWNVWQYVAYDDVSLGSNVYMDCSEPIFEATLFPTPTETPTNHVPSPTATSLSTRTPTRTTTAGPTRTTTRTAAPTRTTTAWVYNTSTPQPPTSTPYGEPQPATGTPGPTMTGTITPQTEGTQTGWTGGDLPPGPGDPGNDPGSGDCNRPANAWSIAGWIDYEFCRLFYAVSWQPGHSATLAALPNRYSNYEPMRSVNDIKAQTDLIVTEAAAVNWNGGMGSLPQTTAESYRPGSGSPYNGGRIELDTGSTGVYTQWCQLQLQQAIGSGLMRGVCFTLNVLRAKQLLWLYQAVINLGSVAIAVQSIVNIIRLRLRYA